MNNVSKINATTGQRAVSARPHLGPAGSSSGEEEAMLHICLGFTNRRTEGSGSNLAAGSQPSETAGRLGWILATAHEKTDG